MTDTIAKPPTHLRAAGRKLWNGILQDWSIDRAHDLARLQAAAEAQDRMAEARAAIERDGAYVEGRFGPKAHPALSVERDSRIALLRALRELGVDAGAGK